MPTIPNPAYDNFQNETALVNIINEMVEIIDTIKEDERLKDQEYIDIMNNCMKLHQLKNSLKQNVVYTEIERRTQRHPPPQLLNINEKNILCNKCGRQFVSKTAVKQHQKRNICDKINKYAQFSVKKNKHTFAFEEKEEGQEIAPIKQEWVNIANTNASA